MCILVANLVVGTTEHLTTLVLDGSKPVFKKAADLVGIVLIPTVILPMLVFGLAKVELLIGGVRFAPILTYFLILTLVPPVIYSKKTGKDAPTSISGNIEAF